MTSNKKSIDKIRLFLAIGAILVFVVLLFTSFNALGVKGNEIKALEDLFKNADPEESTSFGTIGVISVSIFELMTGIAANSVVINGLRAAGFMLTLALIIAGLIVYGILSKRFSYKTLKVLAITNAVLLVAIGVLVLCTRPLLVCEAKQIAGLEVPAEYVETVGFSNLREFLYKYTTLRWGAYATGATAIVAALVNVGTLIYAKKNKLEL